MANWSNPTLTSLYTDFVTEVKNRDVDLALGLDPATTSPTNVPTNAIRWNSASFKYQKWDGSTWNDLSTKYIFTAVEVSGATVPVNGMYLSTTNTLNFSTASTASRLTIDGSGNVNIDSGTFYVDAVNNRVGVGTTDPQARLGVAGDTNTVLRIDGSATSAITFAEGNVNKQQIYMDEGNLVFYDIANTAERLRLDASGNLGLGVVPSAWGAGFKAIEGAYGQSLSYDQNNPNTSLVANAFNDGSWKYKISSFGAGRYACSSGAHYWYTAPSGTAGAAITFTQAMTLDASGRLGIGTTGPVNTLDVNGTGRFRLGGNNLVITTDGGNPYLQSEQNAPLHFGTNAQIRATIDSSGRLLVGTTSSRQVNASINALQLQIEGTTYQSSSMSLVTNQNAADGSYIVLGKSRGTSLGSSTIVNSDDSLGALWFCGADGNTMPRSAVIEAFVDATPGASDMPSRLVFSTTADGAPSPTPRMQINNLGYMQGTVNGLGAGRIPAKQYYRLDSSFTGTNGTAAQPIYGVGVTLVGSTVYEFEAIYALARSSGSTSHTMSFLFGGTATINNIFYTGVGPGESGVPPLNTYDAAPTSFVANSAVASVATGAMTFAGGVFYLVKGTVSINAGGTFIPQYQLSAAPGGAYSTYAGAYFSIWPLAASGAAVNIGSWA